jgi:hypothetical protein
MKVKVCMEFFWGKGAELLATGDLLHRLVAVTAGPA